MVKGELDAVGAELEMMLNVVPSDVTGRHSGKQERNGYVGGALVAPRCEAGSQPTPKTKRDAEVATANTTISHSNIPNDAKVGMPRRVVRERRQSAATSKRTARRSVPTLQRQTL